MCIYRKDPFGGKNQWEKREWLVPKAEREGESRGEGKKEEEERNGEKGERGGSSSSGSWFMVKMHWWKAGREEERQQEQHRHHHHPPPLLSAVAAGNSLFSLSLSFWFFQWIILCRSASPHHTSRHLSLLCKKEITCWIKINCWLKTTSVEKQRVIKQ